MQHNVIISDEYFNEILSSIGYPLADLTDLGEFAPQNGQPVSAQIVKSNIIDLVIFPAMRSYYKWFPIPYIQEFSVGEGFTIDFPDPEVFTVLDVRLNTAGFGARDTVNPFVNNSIYRAVNSTSSYGGAMWGTKYDYGMKQARIYDRMERASFIDMNKAVRFDVDDQNRTLKGYSNITGKIVITWGKMSENFGKIPYNRIDEVVQLSKANLLDHIGTVRGMQNSTLPNSFNYQLLLDKAKTLRTEVIDKWKNFTKVVIQKG